MDPPVITKYAVYTVASTNDVAERKKKTGINQCQRDECFTYVQQNSALLKLVVLNRTLLPKGPLSHIKNSDYNVILSEVKHLPVCWENNFPEYNVPLQSSRNIYTVLI